MNGSKQWDYIKKEDAASLTVATDSVMVTTAIEAHEKQKVATLDIPGAFLHALLDEEVIMILCGILVDLMVVIDLELYGPYRIIKRQKDTICMNEQSHVRTPPHCIVILPEIGEGFTRIWLYFKSL